MSVGNILPGDVIQVELKYTETLVPTDGIYEFVYPTVVGPRYSNQPSAGASPSEKWVENPYLHQTKPPAYTFDILVSLGAGLPIQEMTCPSHKVNIHYDGPTRASVRLDDSEKFGGNRDFILNYQLAGGKIESGILLSEGEREKFFLLMLQPPKRITSSQIPPREYLFIVDVSGSMYGFPLEISKRLLKDLIGNLRPSDQFNVLLFSGGSSVLSEQSVPANSDNIRRAIDLIERQKGGGGTELLPAMKRALSLPRSEGVSRTLVIATDGYVTVEEEVFDLIRKNLGDANMFTFGIGTSVNRYLLEGMARVGMGEPFVISKIEETGEKADKFRKMIESPVLTNVKIDFGKFEVYDVEPLSIPDVFAERPILVFGKWRGNPVGEITLKGRTGTGSHTNRIDIRKEKPAASNSALRYLWARHRIALLADYNFLRNDPDRIKELTKLGLAYNLLTPYTSFVAIDAQVRLKEGQAVTVKQPLPLPQGVSDYAVGGNDKNIGKTALPSSRRLDSMQGFNVATKKEADQPKEEANREASNEPESRVELGEITTPDPRFKESVEKILKQQIPAIDSCYQNVLGKESNRKGEVTLKLIIGRDGKVSKVSLISAWIRDKKLEQCILEKIKGLRFPATEAKNGVSVTVLLNFKSP
jgi:Ca-activated chloride channel family protein